MLPGVYWFEDAFRNLLYIGKAKNLRHRLKSYRLKVNLVGKTLLLLKSSATVRYALVASELQALILEAELIHTYTPKYNIRLKDDRSPLYIIITAEDFPRVLAVRKPELQAKNYQLQASFGPFPSGLKTRLILKVLRRIFPFCNASLIDKLHHRPCFYSFIGLCPGACVGKVSRRQYAWGIKHLALFLAGREAKVIAALTHKMHALARVKAYEQAATLRDQLGLIEELKQKRLGQVEADELGEGVASRIGLQTLKRTLKLPKLPHRIEGYDIANLQGKFSVGSLVVFLGGKKTPEHYRYFKIRSVKSPNDTASLAEVISRRLEHPDWGIPDLFVIDGGKSQVNAVQKVLSDHKPPATRHKLDWDFVPVLGIAKREELLLYSGQNIRLSRRSPALKLVQAIRDEAHRFARTLHHKLHQKSLLEK